jgi:hypothetical protein
VDPIAKGDLAAIGYEDFLEHERLLPGAIR